MEFLITYQDTISSLAPIADGVFTQDDNPCLLGGLDKYTNKTVFPLPDDAERYTPVSLPRTGKIWSWTVQRFRPKSPPYEGPEEFEPYGVAYIELAGAVIVESVLVDVDFDNLHVGQEMELVIVPFTKLNGQTVQNFAFRPLQSKGQ